MTARRATALLCAAAMTIAPAAALADGDPASDVLLIQDVYLPYTPTPAKPLSTALTTLVRQLKKQGYPLKLALIETRGDLGAYPELYDKPAPYAKLLASEILFAIKKPHLIVVMPSGVAGRNLGPRGDAALATIRPDAAAHSDGLVRAALQAVARVASANGHPTQVPAIRAQPAASATHSGGGSSSHTALYVVAAIVVALGIALVGVSVRTRRAA